MAQVVVRVGDEHAHDQKRDHEDAADEAEHRCLLSAASRDATGRRRVLHVAGPFAPRWLDGAPTAPEEAAAEESDDERHSECDQEHPEGELDRAPDPEEDQGKDQKYE